MDGIRMFPRPIAHSSDLSASEVREARFARFLQELDLYERRLTVERTLDAFLDLYSLWRHTHQAHLKLSAWDFDKCGLS